MKDKYPNGAEGYLWTDARVIWNNGACLNVQNTLSYPEDGPGTNMQGISMYCSSGDKGAMIRHSDQYRGIEYCLRAESPTRWVRPSIPSPVPTTSSSSTLASSSPCRSGTATDP